MVKVSVIVPVYNAEIYLKTCLESLLHQTLENIEVICINDCSIDDSRIILREYEKEDERIKIVDNKENIGASASRNIGLEVAVGEYIQFVDADDYLEENALEELYLAAQKDNADMCYLGMQLHTEGNPDGLAAQKGIQKEYAGVFGGKELLQQFTINDEFFLYLWSVFYRREFLEEHGLKYKKIVIGEGGDFILRALCLAKRVIVNKGKFYHYRVHGASITHSENAKRKLLTGQIVQYTDVLQYFARNEDAIGIADFLKNQYRKMVGGIQGVSEIDREEIESGLNTEFSKYVFQLLQQKSNVYGIAFDEETLDRIHKKKFVIIYGAGYASKEIIELLQQHSIEIVGFAVTKRKNEQKCVYGHHLYEIQELASYHEEAIVLVAANRIYNQEIEKTLLQYGFEDYIFLNVRI